MTKKASNLSPGDSFVLKGGGWFYLGKPENDFYYNERRLEKGDSVTFLGWVDAEWAYVATKHGVGYMSRTS